MLKQALLVFNNNNFKFKKILKILKTKTESKNTTKNQPTLIKNKNTISFTQNPMIKGETIKNKINSRLKKRFDISLNNKIPINR